MQVSKPSNSAQPAHKPAQPAQPLHRNTGTSYGRSSGYARSSTYQRDFSGFKYL